MKKYIMRYLVLTILFCLVSQMCMAQKMVIESFYVDPSDMTASVDSTKDTNGELCALVKVQLPRKGATFLGELVGEVAYSQSEYLLHLLNGAKRLDVKLDGYMPLSIRFSDYGEETLRPKKTYKMVIALPQSSVLSSQPKEQFALFVVNPQNAHLLVDNQLVNVSEGAATVKLTTSENHRYSIASEGYETQSGVLNLSAGPVTMNVNLQPIYCTVDFVSNPLQMELSVDGQVIGKTPISVSNLLAGNHIATFNKPGYVTQTKSFEASNLSSLTVEITALKDESPSDMTIANNNAISVKHDEKESTTLSSLQESRIFAVKGIPFTMINVKGGEFMMGNNDLVDATVHKVFLDDYYIGESEVTQALWKVVMGSNPSWMKGDNLPVVNVSWDDCQKFIKKLNKLTGYTFFLPTEAQWEYAARGGRLSHNTKYSGSNKIEEVAWYLGNSNDSIHPVKTKMPNELGIYDMSGNVNEWCQDIWATYNYGSGYQYLNPDGPSELTHDRSFCVKRGGCWNYFGEWDMHIASRNYSRPEGRFIVTGFRLAFIDTHEFTNIGLKDEQGRTIYWANCNIGADNPEDPGLYFAWGETIGYGKETTDGRSFDWNNYKWSTGSSDSVTKYDSKSVYESLESTDDAASANWGTIDGKSWRMPTSKELIQLQEKCEWKWDKKKNGYTVTGPNGNSIFLPAAGIRKENNISHFGQYGYYMSSSISFNKVYSLSFSPTEHLLNEASRPLGFSVRPVFIGY